jgi:hypothetical protein
VLLSSLVTSLMLLQGALGSELRKDGYSVRLETIFRVR